MGEFAVLSPAQHLHGLHFTIAITTTTTITVTTATTAITIAVASLTTLRNCNAPGSFCAVDGEGIGFSLRSQEMRLAIHLVDVLKCLHMSHDRTNRKRLGLDPLVVTEHLYGLGKSFNIRAQHEHSSSVFPL